MVELYFLGALFIMQMIFIYFVATKMVVALEDVMDAMSKLAQLGHLYGKAKTVREAVENQVVLENELSALSKAEEALESEIEAGRGRPTGFKDVSGRIIKFLGTPDANLLSRIPKERLIYN